MMRMSRCLASAIAASMLFTTAALAEDPAPAQQGSTAQQPAPKKHSKAKGAIVGGVGGAVVGGKKGAAVGAAGGALVQHHKNKKAAKEQAKQQQ